MSKYQFGSIVNRDFRNTLQRLADDAAAQGKAIQDLVAEGQLTEEQYGNLITTVNGMLKSGEVDREDLTPKLRSEVDKVRNKIDKGEVSVYDINKNKGKFDQSYLTQDLIDAITGAPGANILSEVADGSVTRQKIADKAVSASKLSFMNTTKNMFDGEYLKYNLYGSIDTPVMSVNNVELRRTGIVEIEPNKTYTIKIHGTSDKFRVATSDSLPEFGSAGTYTPNEMWVFNDALTEFTFTNNATDYYLYVYVSSEGNEPEMQVELGSEATEYKAKYILDESYTPSAAKALDVAEATSKRIDDMRARTRNLFDEEYYHYSVFGSTNSPIIGNRPDGSVISIIVPIEINKTYTINVIDTALSNRFRVASSMQLPSFDSNDNFYPDGELLAFNDVLNSFTFTNNGGYNYIFVQVSDEGERPRIQVEEGDTATPYVPYYQIKQELLPDTSSEIVEDGRAAERLDAAQLFPTLSNTEMTPTDPGARFIEYFDNKMWGVHFTSGQVDYSEDEGRTWVTFTNSWNRNEWGLISRIIPTSDSEVLACSGSNLRKSSGWGTDTITWSENKVSKHANATLFQFSFDGDGDKFIIVEYGNTVANWPDSRYVWISTDMGETFNVVWDSLEEHGEEINAGTHLHGACYDRWGDRFYFSEGHGLNGGLYCSTDDGATWIQGDGHRGGELVAEEVKTNGPTVIVATKTGLVMGSDNGRNGLFGLLRKENPLDEIVTRTYKAEYERKGVIMFAIRGFHDVDTGTVYVAFRSEFEDVPPIICAGTPSEGHLVYEYPNLPVTGGSDHYGAIAKIGDDRLVTYAQFGGSPYTFRGDLVYPKTEISAILRIELKKLGLI